MSEIEVVDLFAGPGGWDEGLRMLGVTNVLGIEFEKHACATAEAAGHRRLSADIAAINPSSVEAMYMSPFTPIAGLIASPPCPGFSAAGKGLGRLDFELLLWAIASIGNGHDVDEVLDAVRAQQNDPRSALTLEPLRWALALRPEWIALEQVPTVLPLWEAYAPVLRSLGYNVWTGNLQAEQYGVPQTRKRAVLMASRTQDVARPVPTHSRYYPRDPGKVDAGVEKWVSMAEALGWSEDARMISNYGTGGDASARGVREGWQPAPTVNSKIDRNKIEWVLRNNSSANAAERKSDQPAPTLYFGARSNYCAWEWQGEGEPKPLPEWAFKRPSTTIVGSFKPEIVAAPGYRTTISRQNAPGSVRVSVEEAGVLQSFRPDYPWQGKQGKQFQQVGNAVPPLLAAHVLAALGVGTLTKERAA